MLTYNTQLKKLVLPEYGRNIQQMVDHCLTIENRDERTACAKSIVDAMGILFPEFKDSEESHKLWDHLAIMSDFKLDIDYPCEIVKPETLDSLPEKVKYTEPYFDKRQYGRYLLAMIDRASQMEVSDERDTLVFLIANQMKKTMLAYGGTDFVDDQRVYNDLAILSRGAIRLTPEICSLNDYIMPPSVNGKKKKKK